jgi:hypothetical protein
MFRATPSETDEMSRYTIADSHLARQYLHIAMFDQCIHNVLTCDVGIITASLGIFHVTRVSHRQGRDDFNF